MPREIRRSARARFRSAAVLAEPDQLHAERPVVLLHEVHQHVHAPRADRLAGDLATGDEGDTELVGPHAGGPDPGQRIVVGEGHGAAAGDGGQLRDPLGGITTVGDVGVGVQIDHPRPGYREAGSGAGPRAHASFRSPARMEWHGEAS